MNIKTGFLAAALGTGILLLYGCGEGSSGSMATTGSVATAQPQTQMLDTQQVLALARVTSETSDPTVVGSGGLMVADADDNTSDPVPVG
jgi:hypothetical protein